MNNQRRDQIESNRNQEGASVVEMEPLLDHASMLTTRDQMGIEDDNQSDQSSSSSGQGASSSSMARAVLADALSSSLATMMEVVRHHDRAGSSRKMEISTSEQQQSTESSSDSTERPDNGCRGSSSNNGGIQTSSGLGVVTTGTSTSTSSGEDKYSVSDTNANRVKMNLENNWVLQRQHHHSPRPHDQQHHSRMPIATAGAVSARMNVDLDRAGPPAKTTHAAVVVAHLPAPRLESSASSSFLSSSSEKGGSGAEEPTAAHAATSSLLVRHREPALHTIRRTLKQLAPKEADDDYEPKQKKKAIHSPSTKLRWGVPSRTLDKDFSGHDQNGGSSGSSSGSGTEGGYVGSASSNEQMVQGSCSSPSVSSDDSREDRKGLTATYRRQAGDASASNIADFSSGDSESLTFESRFASTPSSPSVSSDELDESRMQSTKASRKRRRSEPWTGVSDRRHGRARSDSMPRRKSDAARKSGRGKAVHHSFHDSKRKSSSSRQASSMHSACHKPPILCIGSDIMAHILTFLEPPEIHDVLTMPLSKDWRSTFSLSPELWRVLCLLEPFKAKVDDDDGGSSDDSCDSQNGDHLSFGRHRLMYASFVRCMKYLARIKDDAMHGRPPSVVGYSTLAGVARRNIGANKSLKNFFAKARTVVGRNVVHGEDSSVSSNNSVELASQRMHCEPIGVSDEGSSVESGKEMTRKKKSSNKKSGDKKVRYGFSTLTNRLLGPASTGEAGTNIELPWSCAIYSIVNWMVAFSDVEGIQVMCLKVLPSLLEDEQQRITAQRAGLTDIVLRDMVLFPESSQLNTAAFHTIVLLARPLGGREGMLFHSSMVNSSGIFNSGSQSGKNGIAVMLDAMRRFEHDDVLQAMSCWALVNVALAPSQKAMLVKLGGIGATANAMMQHPYSAEVQFRALFALINLVIPSVNLPQDSAEERMLQEQLGDVNDVSEKEMLDESVGQITNLVVVAMKNFCSSDSILNRACLVLHNLSLTQEYHTTLLWTPNCYQMLEWCLANYRTDQVLQQSAAGTLHRLQVTLSRDENLRTRFAASLHAQQQQNLEQARREAMLLHEHQQQLLQRGQRNM